MSYIKGIARSRNYGGERDPTVIKSDSCCKVWFRAQGVCYIRWGLVRVIVVSKTSDVLLLCCVIKHNIKICYRSLVCDPKAILRYPCSALNQFSIICYFACFRIKICFASIITQLFHQI